MNKKYIIIFFQFYLFVLMLKLVKSPYLRIEIFDYLTTKRLLQIIKHSKEFLNKLEYSVEHYKLYDLFFHEVDTENDIDIPGYYTHYLIKFPKINPENLKFFFFRCLRDLEKITVFPRKEISIECLDYLYENYFGKLIICLANPYKEVPLIKNNVNEIRFLFERIDSDSKQDYFPYIKRTLFEKIEDKTNVQMIKFCENLNLDKEDNEDLYYELKDIYPNATYNLESEFSPDEYYYSQIGKYNNFKFNVPILDNEEIKILNNILISKKDLIDLTIHFQKNPITIIDDYLNKKIVKYFCLMDFIYQENIFYFENCCFLEKLWIIQRIYKRNKCSLNISPKLNKLKVFSCEKVFMTEESFCNVINNNPLLETVKFDKNYSEKERFSIKAAKALSNLKYLRNLTSDNFDKNEKEVSKFYLNFKNNSIRNLNIFNEGFVDYQILDYNLPFIENIRFENVNLIKNENKKLNFKNLIGIELRRVKEDTFLKELVEIRNIEELSYSTIEKNNFIMLTDIISQLNNLNSLSIIPNFFTDFEEVHIINFINKIKDFSLLEDLCFGIPDLTEDIVNCVYDNIIQIKKLYSVRIIVSKKNLTLKEKLMEKISTIKTIISHFEFI